MRTRLILISVAILAIAAGAAVYESPKKAAERTTDSETTDTFVLHHVYTTALDVVQFDGCVSVLPIRVNGSIAAVAVNPGLHAVLNGRVIYQTCGVVRRDPDSASPLESQASVNEIIDADGTRLAGVVEITITPRDSLTWGQVTSSDDINVSMSETRLNDYAAITWHERPSTPRE